MATNNALVPIELTAQRTAARMVEALARLGFEKRDLDGRIWTPTFCELLLYPDHWLVCQLDTERLYHTPSTALATDEVARHLSSVIHYQVRAMTRNGLYYIVNLGDSRRARLPRQVALDLGNRPAGALLVPVGATVDGGLWRTLPQIGHALVAGTSGAGKSTWLQCALAALLTANEPDALRVALVDCKRIGFSLWAGAPHLLAPVATDEHAAAAVLDAIVAEMDKRTTAMAQAGALDWRELKQPAILVVVDEALDLVALSGGARSELATNLTRVASVGRGAGVYLWASAQHPRFDVLPRMTVANLSTRIVFRVVDASAARMVGTPGAQDIARTIPGRMLARLDGPPVELQGYVLGVDELRAITQGVATSATSANTDALDDAQVDLVRYAVNVLGGAFVVNKLARHVPGWTNHKVFTLAQRWQARGWLTPPGANGRMVTDALRRAAGMDADQVGNEAE